MNLRALRPMLIVVGVGVSLWALAHVAYLVYFGGLFWLIGKQAG